VRIKRHDISMSTPLEYTSRTVPHDGPPPPYSRKPEPTATTPSSTHLQQSQRSSQDTPLVEDHGQSAWARPHTCTLPIIEPSYSRNSSESSNQFSAVTQKSQWQRLKEENEVRTAKTLHVTHEQAAETVGRDEEWLKERGIGTTGENQWVRKGNSGCVVM
jgi:hypothetical protein